REVSLRTPGKAYVLREFRVAFASAAELEPLSFAAAEELLAQVVRDEPPDASLEDTMRDGPRESADLPRFAKRTRDQPWYRSYRATLAQTFEHHETQLFGAPIGTVVIVSTLDEDPFKCFEQLCSPHFLPSGMKSGLYDANIPRFYVLVHDLSQEGATAVDVQAMEARMRQALPPGSFFLVTLENDLTTRSAEPQARSSQVAANAKLFGPFDESTIGSMSKEGSLSPGYNLTANDIDALGKFAGALMMNGILSALETRLFALDTRVTAQRKGLRNTFRSFWKKPKTASDASTGATLSDQQRGLQQERGYEQQAQQSFGVEQPHRRVRYLHDSIEANIRLLADIAFMVQDYEMAASVYRLARDDFGSDREHLHQGSAMQMIALCNLMKGSNERDVLDYLRRAQACFREALNAARSKTDKSEQESESAIAARFMTHSTMYFVDVVLAMGGSARIFREATELLARASLEETHLCSALLLEKTGLFLIYQELASSGQWSFNGGLQVVGDEEFSSVTHRLRKFGFHMVMASLLFRKSKNVEHALRCFATVRNIYNGTSWINIQNHIDNTMAQHADALGDLDHALAFWVETLARGGMPQIKQASVIEETKERLEGTSREDPWPFALPVVRDQGIVVIVQHNSSVQPELAPSRPVWAVEELQEHVSLSHAGDTGPRHAQRQTVALRKRQAEATWSSLQERLDKVSPRAGAAEDAFKFRRGKKAAWQANEPETCFVGEPLFVDVPLRNPCALALTLSQVGLVAQVVDEQGDKHRSGDDDFAAWLDVHTLNSVVLEEDREQMVRLLVTPRQPGVLSILGMQWKLFGLAKVERLFVIEGPKLNEEKEHRVSGARATDMRLNKTVKQKAAWFGAELDCPTEVLSGQLMNLALDVINLGQLPCQGAVQVACNLPSVCMSGQTQEEGFAVGDVLAKRLDEAGTIFELPVADLEPGLPMSVPMVVRLGKPGLQVLRMLLRYSDGNVVRYVRVAHKLMVLPSVEIETRTLRCPQSLSDCLVTCTVRNLAREPICLSQVCGLSGHWELQHIQGGQEDAGCALAVGECKVLVFRAVKRQNDATQSSSVLPLGLPDAATAKPNAEEEEQDGVSDACRLHLLLLEHAERVLTDRSAAHARFLRFKDQLDSEGRLPVSIQEIRRLNRQGSTDAVFELLHHLEAQGKAQEGEPDPCELASLYWPPRDKLLHMVFEWRTETQGLLGQHQLLSQSMETPNPFRVVASYAQTCVSRTLDVAVTVCNWSDKDAELAVLDIGRVDKMSWMGPTRRHLPCMHPGDAHTFSLRAVFHSSGVFNLNCFRVSYRGETFGFEESSMFCTVQNHLDDPLEPLDLPEDQHESLPSPAAVSAHTPGSLLSADVREEESFLWAEHSRSVASPPLGDGMALEHANVQVGNQGLMEPDTSGSDVVDVEHQLGVHAENDGQDDEEEEAARDPSSPRLARLSKESSMELEAEIRDMLGDDEDDEDDEEAVEDSSRTSAAAAQEADNDEDDDDDDEALLRKIEDEL
ncbi:Trafficking protein particle complex subunit 8 (Protein TRS85 homolog), partial [Durusdinium trenchii]